MKCVLAPDSFKGSLSSTQVCEALALGVRRVFPQIQIVSIPLADGGEGTLEALIEATGGKIFSTPVRGPLDENVEAQWGLLPDGTTVIEMAQSSGLTLTPESQRNALRASTYGLGQLIKKALQAGSRQFFIGLGGSATTDGGTGALAALGARFFDANGVVLPLGGGFLEKLHRVDLTYLDARLEKAHFTLLCDVENPLTGPNGAAHVYAPQKGATQEDVQLLETGLQNLARVTTSTKGNDNSQASGAGAAGGTAFGFLAYCNAAIRPGIEAILEQVQFEEKVQDADFVLTGEGAIDAQTLSGKAIAGICKAAQKHHVPVIAFGGKVEISGHDMDQLGLLSAFPLADGARNLDYCFENAASLLETASERALRLWKLQVTRE